MPAPMPLPATKAGRVHDALRADILSGDLAAGEPLDEATVAAAHGVSRTPVREALRALHSEGLLVIGQRRQLHVVDVSPEHRQEITSLRIALEGAAVEQACSRCTDDDLDRLRLLVRRQQRQAETADSAGFLVADEDFHRALAEVAGMPTLMRLLEQLGAFVRLARLGVPTPRQHMLGLVREHDHLLDLLEEGDARTLTRQLGEHIRNTSPRE